MSLLIPLTLAAGLLAAGVGMSLLALLRARMAAQAAARNTQAAHEEQEIALEAMRRAVDDLAAQVHEIRMQPAAAPAAAGTQRAALNLSKRSQALRMHRRGESPERIAAALEIPRQELDLLLKVHRIVMSNI